MKYLKLVDTKAISKYRVEFVGTMGTLRTCAHVVRCCVRPPAIVPTLQGQRRIAYFVKVFGILSTVTTKVEPQLSLLQLHLSTVTTSTKSCRWAPISRLDKDDSMHLLPFSATLDTLGPARTTAHQSCRNTDNSAACSAITRETVDPDASGGPSSSHPATEAVRAMQRSGDQTTDQEEPMRIERNNDSFSSVPLSPLVATPSCWPPSLLRLATHRAAGWPISALRLLPQSWPEKGGISA
ncbi:hypothetical protein LY76DRAFT_289113 [Colletotrichum caudatum]|nr:hypothetical protein LY76DRAFT_289113 [Colletotrichum caudatum]